MMQISRRIIAMSKGLKPELTFAVAALIMGLSSGCSLINSQTRPEPDAPRNLSCAIEYRPDSGHQGPDILFVAAANPYRMERFYMSLVDNLIHLVFAPGRHLTEDIRIRGAECESPWKKGRRLPLHFTPKDFLLCRRTGLDPVEIEARTAYGVCRVKIPQGDAQPRCREWYGPENEGLQRMSPGPCSPHF